MSVVRGGSKKVVIDTCHKPSPVLHMSITHFSPCHRDFLVRGIWLFDVGSVTNRYIVTSGEEEWIESTIQPGFSLLCRQYTHGTWL